VIRDAQRTRVLFLGQHVVLPEAGIAPHGSGAHTAATVSGLREHFDVCLVTAADENAAADTPTGISRARLLPERVRGARRDLLSLLEDRRFVRRALDEARAFRPDVVYERSEYLSTAGLNVSRALGVPLVLEVNGTLDRDVRSIYRSLLEPLGALLERRKHRRAEVIVTVTPGLATLLEARGADAERIVVAPNSVDPARVSNATRAARASAVVGWIGHLMPWHVESLEFLIDAAPSVLAGCPAARFRVIGGGPGLRGLEERVRARGLAESFDFVGPVSHERVQAELDRVDVGVIPAVFDYAFPVKLVEMGAVGLPVVAPRSESLDQLIEPGKEYEPFTPGDEASFAEALVGVLNDPEHRDRLGEGLRRATEERFTWTVVGETTALAVEQALTARRD
jgi:glycosyltransferase involved in cell wall biosynthesis